jgi:hypothetical protein
MLFDIVLKIVHGIVQGVRLCLRDWDNSRPRT